MHRIAYFLAGMLTAGMLAVYLWPEPPVPRACPAPTVQQHVDWWFTPTVDKRAAVRHICRMETKQRRER